MKKLLLPLTISSFLFGSEASLDVLMKKYNKEVQPHKKTLYKNGGDIIVYTREDLDYMQAFTLNDILRTVRFFHLATSRMGESQLIKSGSKNNSVTPFKIFIDNHELNAVTFGNAIAQYGFMNLYFVDYIEIYQAGNTLANGNDTAGMIIRIYTKDPLRENGIFTQITYDTLGETRLNVIDARKLNKQYSYLLNLDLQEHKTKTVTHHGYKLKRDANKAQFFAKFTKKDDYEIAFSAMKDKADPFTTFSLTPQNNKQIGKNFYLHMCKQLGTNSFIKASTSLEYIDIDYTDTKTIQFIDGSNAKHIQIDLNTRTSVIEIQNHQNFKNHKILFGASFERMEFEPKSFILDGVSYPSLPQDLKKNIYSVYTQSDYFISSNIMLISGLKYNYYTLKAKEDSKDIIYRLGTKLQEEKWSLQLFFFNKIGHPTLNQLYFSPFFAHANANLKAMENRVINLGLNANVTKKFNFQAGFADSTVTNAIVINPTTKTYINNPDTIHFQRFYTRFDYEPNLDTKFTLDYFQIFKDKTFSSERGFFLKADKSFNKLTVYNELVYRNAYTDELGHDISSRYDYTLAISYQYSKKLLLKLKGENLFDKAYKSYIYDSNVPSNGFFLQERSRRVLISMEYTLK